MTPFLLLLLAVLQVSQAKTENPARLERKAGQKALGVWGSTLSPDDYNASLWQQWWSQPQNFFEHYAHKLSGIYAGEGAKVNFVLVGACDGTNDKTIRDLYLPNAHIRGAFVEPFSINYQDLVGFMKKNNVADKSHTIHGAATDKCAEEIIKMKRPTYEEKNTSLPHWMRREIGSIVPADKMDRPATGGWIFEYVKCYTASTILKSWETSLYGSSTRKGYRMRPHILKVDVEGHDYQVLSSFLELPAMALPLLISFEAKSIKQQDELRTRLEERGYIVSHMANDGFALLKPKIKRGGGGGGGGNGGAGGEEEPVVMNIDPSMRKRKRAQGQDDAQAPSGEAGEEDGEEAGGRAAGKRRRRKSQD